MLNNIINVDDIKPFSVDSAVTCHFLPVSYADRESLSVFHRNGQGFFARKRRKADDRPVPGLHRLRVDFRDLFFRRLAADERHKPVLFSQPADRAVILDLSDPDQFRAAELHALHIRNE